MNKETKQLNVGTVKQVKKEAIFYGKKGDAFMDGWRFARNNLQKQKVELLKKEKDEK